MSSATIVVEFVIPKASTEKVKRVLAQALDKAYPMWAPVRLRVERVKPATSRPERWAEAKDSLADAKSEAEELKTELENWRDTMPENLQTGTKNEELEEAIEQLESFISSCEEAEDIEPDFPTMF